MKEDGVLNDRLFGSLLRGLRKPQFDRGQDFCDVMYKATGLRINERTLTDIERGKQEATFREIASLVVTLKPPRGIHYFGMALNPELAEAFMQANCPPARAAEPEPEASDEQEA